MDRRKFLAGVGGACFMSGVGALGITRRVFARREFSTQLMREVNPILVDREHQELSNLPANARREVLIPFRGACNNAHLFVEEVCSESFGRRLRECTSETQQRDVVANAFFAHVMDAKTMSAKIMDACKHIAEEIDTNWRSDCVEIAGKWKVRLKPGSHPALDNLQSSIESKIKADVDKVVIAAASSGDKFLLEDAVTGSTTCALVLFPAAMVAQTTIVTTAAVSTAVATSAVVPVLVPLVVLVALTPMAVWLWEEWAKGATIREYQRRIQLDIRSMALTVADNVESEIRANLAQLHGWRHEALKSESESYANEQIGLFY